ncbi:MAG: hypothetical protein LBK23_09165 [Oscillospiraceae bacterium]|jgi:hypothetical protein|nr:hypothetical protein [Oscillospiraceae bacterium]
MNAINEGMINIAIEALTAQVADSYAEAQGIPVTEALQFFMTTKTFELLINPKSYLCLETAPYVEDMLNAELSGDWDSWMEV